jgi:S-adenosylmethionine decarboxylase proenzyme
MQGVHLTADLQGCVAASPLGDLMRDPLALRRLCLDRVAAAGLRAVGELFHRFGDPGGVTGVVLLAESHVAVHTWPEQGAVTLDVYVCNVSRDNTDAAHALASSLIEAFDPRRVARRLTVRGDIATAAAGVVR